jgi:hypothetical protein
MPPNHSPPLIFHIPLFYPSRLTPSNNFYRHKAATMRQPYALVFISLWYFLYVLTPIHTGILEIAPYCTNIDIANR